MSTPTIIVYGITNCDTVKKARVWLDQNGHAFAFFFPNGLHLHLKKIYFTLIFLFVFCVQSGKVIFVSSFTQSSHLR